MFPHLYLNSKEERDSLEKVECNFYHNNLKPKEITDTHGVKTRLPSSLQMKFNFNN